MESRRCSKSHLEDGDVPGVALHGLLKFATLQALLRSDAMQVFVEVQACGHRCTTRETRQRADGFKKRHFRIVSSHDHVLRCINTVA